jgi:hypothetical protein
MSASPSLFSLARVRCHPLARKIRRSAGRLVRFHLFTGKAPFVIEAGVVRLRRLAPRAIISCSSSWLLERASAVSIVICFWK